MSVDVRKERFELVEVFDRPMLFTCLRVDRNTVPKGLYLYEVRNDDDQCGIPVEIGRWIMVNHWGTLLSATPIKLEPNRYNNNAYRHIDPENDWNYTGDLCSAREYMDKYLLKRTGKTKGKIGGAAHGTQISGDHGGLPAGDRRTGPRRPVDGISALCLPEL